MNLARKKQIVYAGLIVFTLWPLVQMQLVRRFEVCAWKLAGWGMYATPRIAPGVGILVRERGADALVPLQAVPTEIRAESEAFQIRRLWLRKLASPDRLGRMVLASNPRYEHASILVLELVLDVNTGMVRSEDTTYDYEREGEQHDNRRPATVNGASDAAPDLPPRARDYRRY